MDEGDPLCATCGRRRPEYRFYRRADNGKLYTSCIKCVCRERSRRYHAGKL